jgi:hypothetical protein
MVLIINGGPTGCGNRLQLPVAYIFLSGVWELFPEPE